jgi:hypothetical protein
VSNVIDMQAWKEAHELVRVGWAQCSLCSHAWRAGVALDYDGLGLQCPACGVERAGLFPVAPLEGT